MVVKAYVLLKKSRSLIRVIFNSSTRSKQESFIVYIAIFSTDPKMLIHLAKKARIVLLIIKEVTI